jgi:hypothetical protein
MVVMRIPQILLSCSEPQDVRLRERLCTGFRPPSDRLRGEKVEREARHDEQDADHPQRPPHHGNEMAGASPSRSRWPHAWIRPGPMMAARPPVNWASLATYAERSHNVLHRNFSH